MLKMMNNSILMDQYNFSTESECLFAQKWREMFLPGTINTYQFKLRNAHTILEETKDVIRMIKKQNISTANLPDLLLECKKHLEKDRCIKKYYRELLSSLLNSLKPKFEKNELFKLEFRINNALKSISPTYKQHLIVELQAAIEQNNLEDVEHYSELLASELVNSGWSPRSLERLVKITFMNKKDGDLFESKWLNFVEKINTQLEEFNCYFKLSKNDFDSLSIINMPDINIVKGIDIYSSLRRGKEHVQIDSYYLCETTMSHYEDMNSAIENCKSQLAGKQSILSFFHIDLERPQHLLVVFPNNIKAVNYELRIESAINKTYIGVNINSTFEIMKNERLLLDDRQRLSNFFRQYDLSIHAPSLETIYSNLWSSLESLLLIGHHSSNIEHIKKTVPALLCGNYIQRLLQNFLFDCKRAKATFDMDDVNCIFDVLTNQEKQEEFLEYFNDYTLLKQRCLELIDVLSNSNNLKEVLTNHHNNMTWHIQRMYRVRNNLVHSATVERDIKLLIEHMHFYTRNSLHEILLKLNKYQFNSLGDLYMAVEDNYNTLIEVLTPVKGKIESYDHEIIFEGPLFIYHNY
ncbi:hypothetical protein [Viridibacillus arvi]|uniref:hypothetical protein n=1 Tax=Viridibacillus arvi TaxID=263475 RepID=UPI003D27070B